MEIFLGVFILVVAITGMSVGVIFNRNLYLGLAAVYLQKVLAPYAEMIQTNVIMIT